MDAGFAIDIGRRALLTGLMLVAPAMTVALCVGLLTAIFQAVTSVREMTLAVIPKILAVSITLMLCMGWMLQVLIAFASGLFARIGTMGG